MPLAAVGTPAHAASGAWTWARAFARAALGLIFGFGLGILYEVIDDPSLAAEDLTSTVLLGLLIIAAIFAGVVVVIEKLVPPLRIPGGALYGAIGHNRWIVSGILGAIPALLFLGIGADWIFAALMVIGFLAAEALVGRRSAVAGTAV